MDYDFKSGDLILTKCGRFGILKAYYSEYEEENGFPWYVYMPDSNFQIEYFTSSWIEVISASR